MSERDTKKRRDVLRSLVMRERFTSQVAIGTRLAELGYDVSQTTWHNDLDALEICQNQDGVYVLPEHDVIDNRRAELRLLMREHSPSFGDIKIKTLSIPVEGGVGYAQLMGGAIEALYPEVLGFNALTRMLVLYVNTVERDSITRLKRELLKLRDGNE